jgi:hypothetical protein
MREQARDKVSYLALNSPSDDAEMGAAVDDIVTSLFCVLVSNGQVTQPRRCRRPRPFSRALFFCLSPLFFLTLSREVIPLVHQVLVFGACAEDMRLACDISMCALECAARAFTVCPLLVETTPTRSRLSEQVVGTPPK